MDMLYTAEELDSFLSDRPGKTIVCFRKDGCLSCMKVSALIPFLDSDDRHAVYFDCSIGYDESKTFGVSSTPVWLLFEDGRQTASVHPSHDDDELWDFLTECAGLDILRPIFDLALEQGRAYAKKAQAAIAELMFRSKDDESGIVSAAVLKICKACIDRPESEFDCCIDEQIDYCISRLQKFMDEPDEDTDARRDAIAQIREKKAEIRDELLKAKSQSKEED